MLYIIAYDIPTSKKGERRRNQIARLLEGYGIRVQYSVFEVEIAPEKLPQLVEELEKLINEKEDSIRVYPLCAACAQRAFHLGIDAFLEGRRLLIW